MKDHRIADKLIEQRFEEISKKTDALPKTQVNYIFVTDTHADEYLLKDENGKLTVFEPEDTVNDRINQIAKHLEIAVNIANKNDNIDFIAVGGDLMNAYCIKGKEHVLSNLHRSVAPLKNSLKPVLIAFGNHDDNAFQFLNPNIPAAEREWIISDKDWKEKVTDLFPGADGEVHDDRYEYSKYYYYDLKKKRTRIIILDTMDAAGPFDENGVCKRRNAIEAHMLYRSAARLARKPRNDRPRRLQLHFYISHGYRFRREQQQNARRRDAPRNYKGIPKPLLLQLFIHRYKR